MNELVNLDLLPLEFDFFKFIYYRQLVWYKRFVLKEKPPWTLDEILAKFKFCNVYRELDKCTLYILNKLKSIDDRRKIFFNVVFFRFFNRTNLYEDLGIKPFLTLDLGLKNKIIYGFKEKEEKGLSVFNNAYIISSNKKGEKKYKTVINIIEKLSGNVESLIAEIDKSKTPDESFEVIKKIPLVGSFLANEIWTDLTYFRFFKQGWTDNDFVSIGPGSKWGLELVYGRKLKRKDEMQKLRCLYNLQNDVLLNVNKSLGEKDSWGRIFYGGAFSNIPYLSITNIEGSLCEFRKYLNLKRGIGRRRYYEYNRR